MSEFPHSNYSVSNFGRVKNDKSGIILRQGISASGKGYPKVCIRHRKKTKYRSVHRLVAMAFLGHYDGLTVNHIDGNPFNNHVSNLEWVTQGENLKHSYTLGRRISPSHTLKKKIRIVETGQIFDGVRDCARAINGTHSSIVKQLKGYVDSYKEFTFEYV